MKNSSIKKKIINAPISIGELVDKITILEIKKIKLQNSKLENVLKELSFLRKLMEKHQIEIMTTTILRKIFQSQVLFYRSLISKENKVILVVSLHCSML